MQDINPNKVKLKVNHTCIEDEKISTNFEISHDKDVINKAYFNKKISKKEGHKSFIEKDWSDIRMHSKKKQSKDVLTEKAVKSTTQILQDKVLVDKQDNADEALKIYALSGKSRFELEKLNDDVLQGFSKIQLEKQCKIKNENSTYPFLLGLNALKM